MYLDKFKYAEFHGDVHFFCFRLEIPFWTYLVQKFKIISLSWIFALDSFEYAELCKKYLVFTFFVLHQKNPFWTNLAKKIKIVSWSRNLVPRDWFEYAEFNDDVNFFRFWLEIPFCANLIQKKKIVSLSWNFALD